MTSLSEPAWLVIEVQDLQTKEIIKSITEELESPYNIADQEVKKEIDEMIRFMCKVGDYEAKKIRVPEKRTIRLVIRTPDKSYVEEYEKAFELMFQVAKERGILKNYPGRYESSSDDEYY